MGGVVSKATDFVGLTDYGGAADRQDAATRTAQAGTDASVAMHRENIEFQTKQLEYQKEQYEDWKDVYGDIQSNMGEYYKNLSGDTLASKQLQSQAMEYSTALKDVTRSLAQKGLTGSGIQAATEVAMGMQSAGQRAAIRSSADEQANQQKMQFLGLGLGQGTTMLGQQVSQAGNVGQGAISGANAMLQGSLGQAQMQSAYAQGTQSGSFGMSGNILQAGGSVLGGLASGGFFSDVRLKNNISFDKTVGGVNFYSWEWNSIATRLGLDDTEPYGVIAQEVINIYPEVVSKMDNGYYAIDYKKLHELIGAE